MEKVYFTFGTDPQYPFGINEYVMVEAQTMAQTIELFRAVHPNRPGSDCINCAFFYPEETFNKFRDQYYHNVQPVEVISVQRRDRG